jgi:hypothetical protein
MQTLHCTSKWFYFLTKTMHVLRKISLSCHYITLNSHSRTGQISGIARGRFEVLYHSKTKVNISFMYSFLLNSDQLRAWMSQKLLVCGSTHNTRIAYDIPGVP